MRILWALPTLSPCGGMRVCFEYANRLAGRGHVVAIASHEDGKPSWFDLRVERLTFWGAALQEWDVVIATSPDTVDFASRCRASRRVYFVQMLEYLFEQAGRQPYVDKLKSYTLARDAGFSFITIAEWLAQELTKFDVHHTPVVPNGVNLDQFYPDGAKRDYILVEGDNRNCAKDIYGMGWNVALEIGKKYGVRVMAYSGNIIQDYAYRVSTFVMRPDVTTLRRLYSEALFLVKASRFEGRACAPVEAMACGTTCARAIVAGDDDVINGVTGLRVPYVADDLFMTCKRLMDDPGLRADLEMRALEYAARNLQWGPRVIEFERLLS